MMELVTTWKLEIAYLLAKLWQSVVCVLRETPMAGGLDGMIFQGLLQLKAFCGSVKPAAVV